MTKEDYLAELRVQADFAESLEEYDEIMEQISELEEQEE